MEEELEEKAEEEAKVVEEELAEAPKEEPKIPEFRVGDTVKVFYKIIEGEKMRIQPFEGIVISFRGSDVSKTFTLRRIGADQVGVERILPLHSPNIEKIKVVKRGNVRRAKLFYLRDKVGREAMRVREAKK
ncbi:50S ribosomal protein L19 [candidate division WWE3 bacterium RIFOXYC2_FULL_42_13]|nr:MAG: 50S ribosomal protein L19 [candidate division WWE3 bacterium RIFOXYA2_FULL_43_12]OGC65485.1 MAG: 50S ribosomal protein L19 [candidate division WWE3 bacterium RIFOXYA12_FULL_43_11]OGC71847.1 MAG: 50S ribosomal protein L19 [candidate division WWE3 bacterium RIFOXYB2_FULL_43_9]OGC74128.1 MAG: 50S ribosomal protein L19 [candidate division WWE3 bacterium RIFOXYC2_FULL_42_13]